MAFADQQQLEAPVMRVIDGKQRENGSALSSLGTVMPRLPRLAVSLIFLFVLAAGQVSVAGVGEVIELPAPDTEGGVPLMRALALRRTARQFSEAPLEKQVLSELLWAANGINRPSENKRTAPTSRNWQQIDVYVTMPDGLYFHDAAAHRLVKKNGEDLRALAGTQAFTDNAPLNLVFVADYERMTRANKEQQDFGAATDTGFVSQNVYLYCASRGLNTVVLGSVDKDKLGAAMGLSSSQRVVLSQTVGYPPGAEPKVDEAAAAKPLRDGRWNGTGKGYDGDIVVAVVVADGEIKAVEIESEAESAPGKSYELIPGRVVEARGVEGVDAVTGATVTSNAILEAVAEALRKSRGDASE